MAGAFLILPVLLLCQAAFVNASPEQLSAGPVVDLGFGKYRGLRNESANINQWFKIPYAIPPLGPLRWHAPQPIDSRDPWGAGIDIIDATRPGSECVQGNPAWQWADFNNPPDPKGSEDCLYLNIMAPANRPVGAPLLPVLVKIHSGGYVQGSADWTDGYTLMKHTHGGILYVSIQYRLGVYGFLASNAVVSDGVANAGLLDQRLALNWIRKYISRFGGDGERITIEGGAAGGGSVSLHLMMFGGKSDPPFRGAIADWPWWQPFHGSEVLEAQYRHLLHAAKCENITCLRASPDGVLAAASQQSYIMGYFARPKPYYGYGDFYYGPVVDGKSMLDFPSREFERGRFTPVPILVSRSHYEGYFFSNASIRTQLELETDLKVLIPDASNAFISQLLTLYPASDYPNAFYRRQSILGDMYIDCPTKWIMEASIKKKKGAWKVYFDAGSQLHGATAEYLFDPNYERKPGANVRLAGYMKDWYLSFVTNSDPNRESWLSLSSGVKPIWPVYGEKDEVLHATDNTISAAPDVDTNVKCNFWRNQSGITRI